MNIDGGPDDRFTPDYISSEISRLPVWRHRIDVGHGIVTPGRDDCSRELDRLRVPGDLAGRRVLDIGCSDGYFSFECERRGAREVVACDDFTSSAFNEGAHGFEIAGRLLRSRARFHRASIYELNPAEIGRFDDVLLLNVLYHLRHPLLALERIAALLAPGGVLYLKSYHHRDIRIGVFGFDVFRVPVMRFFESDELNGDPSNWWGPNRSCLEGMLRTVGFSDVEMTRRFGDRIYFRARM